MAQIDIMIHKHNIHMQNKQSPKIYRKIKAIAKVIRVRVRVYSFIPFGHQRQREVRNAIPNLKVLVTLSVPITKSQKI